MQLLGISSLVFLALQDSVGAVQNAVTCTTTADCAWGETCVAGDSDTSVQACVAPTVCGGSSMGNCPSDDSGTLACLWRPFNDCSAGCAILNGSKGIYKCVSLSRCDAYYGDASCSDGCSVNGVRCNGQGSCNMMSSNADGTPVFGCTCENGYSGEKCEAAPGSTEASYTNSSSTDDGSSDDSSADGSDNNNTDDGSADTSNASDDTEGSEDASAGTSDASDNTDGSEADSVDGSEGSSTDASVDSSSDNAEDGSASSSNSASSSGAVATRDSVSSTSRSGIRPGVLILVLVMAAFFLIGTVLLVAYTRRRKQQEREDYANALASTHGVGAVGERDIAAGHTGRTPRSIIATL
ncbi:hypothetical protein PHYPSEUDO_001759 [Phytophthora pseudosyringae]|uniref:EGF-like domain-containing protein n=1 Tax=Phytophthora pseudosyringae TaxID=221518 RepID=A0A8T1VV71_9STRA|nr:hypothetical protein PHYPSEUDO_001759 [Phytophthora pseudosyringae]